MPPTGDDDDTNVPLQNNAVLLEIIVPAGVLVAAGVLGYVLGWRGEPRTPTGTAVWPFYLDTWLPGPVWTWRAVYPVILLLPAILAARRFVAAERHAFVWLALLAASAYAIYFACGVLRFGVTDGLIHTMRRNQEYWWDVRQVKAGFLAQFPELPKPLHLHGSTHPPGITLILALIKRMGATFMDDATLVCSLFAAFTVFPVWGAARRLTDEKTARFAAVLFLFTCSVTLFAILSVDLFTMFFVATSFYGFSRAIDGETGGGLLCGLALGAACLCTFIAATVPLTFAILLWSRRKVLDRRRIVSVGSSVFGFLAFYAVLMVGWGYRPLHVFEADWAAFAVSDNADRSRALAVIGNPIAFLGSLGLPIMGLCGHAVAVATRRRDQTAYLVTAAVAPPILCTAFGTPRGEVEHIFLLFIPAILVAIAAAARRWLGRDERWLLYVVVPVLVLQSAVTEILTDTFW